MPKEVTPIEFRLLNIQLIECSFRKPKEEIADNQNFDFFTAFGVKFEKKSCEIKINVDINVFYSPVQRIQIGKVISETIFHIANFNDFFSGRKKIIFPRDFIMMLMNVAYSTLRGIIIERSASTLPKPVILPIINLNEFLIESEEQSKK